MTEVTKLTLAVDSRQVRTAAGDLDKLGEAGKRSEKAVGGVQEVFGQFRNVIGALALGTVVKQLAQTADAFNNVNAKLALTTRSTTALATAQAELFAISQRTSTEFGKTADLYGALSRSAEQLGVSQSEALGVTESINKALAVSGTNAQSAAAALVQLGQGLSSGVLRGEELNSILEQAPRLARAIADGIGVPIGQLRALGEEGKLTSEIVFKALQSQAGKLDSEFRKMPLTVGRAMEQIGNSFTLLIGKIDKATGATNLFARGLQSVSRLIDSAVGSSAPDGSPERMAALQIEREELQKLVTLYESRGHVLSDTSPEKVRIAAIDALISKTKQINELNAKFEADPRELARRGRPIAAAGGVPLVAPNAPTVRIPRAIAPREEQNLQSTQELQDAISRLEATDLNKISRLRDELKQLLELKANGSTDNRLDAAIADATAELEKMSPAFQEAEQRAERLNSLLGATPSAQLESVRDDIRLLNAEFEAGRISVEKYNEAVNARLGNDKPVAPASEISEIQKNFISGTQNIFADTIENLGTNGLKNLDKQFGDMLLKLGAQAAAANLTNKLFGEDGKGLDDIGQKITEQLESVDFSKISQSLTDVFSSLASSVGSLFSGGGDGGGFGGILSTVAGFFGGGRASGGPVSAGRMYQVNERGPELLNVAGKQFLMMGSQGGTVTPNGGQAKTINAPINITVPGNTDRRTAIQIGAQVQMGLARAGRAL